MKKILPNLLLTIIILFTIAVINYIPDFIYLKYPNLQKFSYLFNAVIVSLSIILTILLLMGITYGVFWDKLTINNRPISSVFLFIICIFISYQYSKFLVDNSSFYNFIKSGYSISGKVFENDSLLGHRAKPNAKGFHRFSVSVKNSIVSGNVPILISSKGFRITDSTYHISKDNLALFLGCSFTWADFCPAEKSYAYLVAKGLQIPYINAGTDAYGMAQIHLSSWISCFTDRQYL